MPVAATHSDHARMTLVTVAQTPGVVVGPIASVLGLERRTVAQRLAQAPAVLAEGLTLDQAERLRSLLAALGVTVRLEAPGAPLADSLVHVAIQPKCAPAPATVEKLATVLRLTEAAVSTGLSGPAGLVLSRPSHEALALRRALRRDAGLRVLVSDPSQARYDLFATGPAQPPGLAATLRRLGLAPCPFSGAVAADLEARTAALVLARHEGALFALDRAFQRFDLFLCAGQTLGREELVDFIATRTSIRRESLLSPAHRPDLRLESGLTREAASRFRADYAELGLETRVALVVPPSDG